jgi:Domain of unknown function (DUF932)
MKVRKLTESTLVSLDGVIEAPERWAVFDDEATALALTELGNFDAFVMGRVTYEMLSGYWGLARIQLALADFHQVIDALWQPPADDASVRTKNNHRRRVDTLTDLYTANSAQLGTTGYAAERTITEYADWKQAIRPTGSLRGNNLAAWATAVLEGSNDLKTRAHRQLLTLTRR